MSGTSLDGLDLCAARFRESGNRWHYEVLAASCVPYSARWQGELQAAFAKTEGQLAPLHRRLGDYIGRAVVSFCAEHQLNPDLVASHGHTVHHRPERGYTLQIGDPARIAALAGVTCVGDFRSLDVSLGGQGAPLVPIADRLLFGAYAQCLNLGGIANVSFERGGARVAADLTVCNQLLNRIALGADHAYDAGGALAASGTVDVELARAFCGLPFHARPAPKSLGREWVDARAWPLFEAISARPRDALATASEGIAQVLAAELASGPPGEILVTGGGAYNTHLVERVGRLLPPGHGLCLPSGTLGPSAGELTLVDVKEALAFALLGVLRLRGEVNALASVTGARRDSSGGLICSAPNGTAGA